MLAEFNTMPAEAMWMIIFYYFGLLIFGLNGLVMLRNSRLARDIKRDVVRGNNILMAIRLRKKGIKAGSHNARGQRRSNGR